jgi:hypothetical protein
VWIPEQLVDAIAEAFETEAEGLDDEQAVYGLDTVDELGLHPLIQHGLLTAGFGVWPERAYPAENRGPHNEARKCDLVLTPTDDQPLLEPAVEGTLFAEERAIPPEGAYWLEVKTAHEQTADGPSSRYASELKQTVTADVAKLASDPKIFHAGVLLILFTGRRSTAEKDLERWHQLVLEKNFPVGAPAIRHMTLQDRSGHGHMAIALFPVRRLG